MFIDEATISVKAGDGGPGCISFRREKFEPFGGPNGGDGGNGGDVVIRADGNIGDLTEFRFRANFRAENGEPGRGSDQHGRAGADCLLKVPPGTVVHDEETNRPIAELTEDGRQVTLCRGGNGGWGNIHFKSSVNRAPRRANDGQPGEEKRIRLELKTIAEVGLVGFPNAGKSTLIGLVSRARPKTGAYPFTTLHPKVGVIEYPDNHDRITIADVPGLIEGASENRGLGHRFLRHIERCRLLLFLIDMAGTDQRDPAGDYEILARELELYNPEVARKPRVVVANKMDLPEAAGNLAAFSKRHGVEVLQLSCATGDGMDELRRLLFEKITGLRANAETENLKT